MLKNQSVATIAAPEFLNIEPYNPLISQCEIKVLYVGENRNGSYITEDVAKDMANSLPGTPIVAAFIENKDDVQMWVSRYVPREINEYIFFDGELMDQYFKDSQRKNIESGIKDLTQASVIE